MRIGAVQLRITVALVHSNLITCVIISHSIHILSVVLHESLELLHPLGLVAPARFRAETPPGADQGLRALPGRSEARRA